MAEDETRYMTLSEVQELITKEAEERELNYEQTLALTHAEKFVELTPEDSLKLINELLETYEFYNKKLAYKTADILPKDGDGVRAIFARDRYTPSEDDSNKVLKTIKKYL